MDFTFTPEQETLKQEFEEYFSQKEKEAPEGWFTAKIDYCYEHDDAWEFHRKIGKELGQKGWLSLPWPEEHGGKGFGQLEQMIFQEIRAYHRIPGFDPGPVVAAAGILEKGTAEQKQKWLPLIASGESTWCEGWSEPNSGSDLASITATTGVLDGNDWVINGQKVWTTGAHRCSHMILMARTDPDAPKHKGITYFLTPMDVPGIEIRPILRMYRGHSFNEVFFDDFRVPKENIISEANMGWYVLMAGMDFERTGVAFVAETWRDFDDLIDFIKENGFDGRSPAEQAMVRHKLAQCQIELEIWRQWAYYVAWLQSKKNVKTTGEASAVKRVASEMMLNISQVGLEVMGMYGPIQGSSKWARLHGSFEYACQHDLGMTIAGGTTEIQKNLIAWMELGLPRK